MNLKNDQEVMDEDEEEEEEEEGGQKQSANHSSRILVEVPVEVRQVPSTFVNTCIKRVTAVTMSPPIFWIFR